jgi:hypothetical protein
MSYVIIYYLCTSQTQVNHIIYCIKPSFSILHVCIKPTYLYCLYAILSVYISNTGNISIYHIVSNTHTYKHTHTNTNINTYKHTHTLTQTLTLTHTNTHTQGQTGTVWRGTMPCTTTVWAASGTWRRQYWGWVAMAALPRLCSMPRRRYVTCFTIIDTIILTNYTNNAYLSDT